MIHSGRIDSLKHALCPLIGATEITVTLGQSKAPSTVEDKGLTKKANKLTVSSVYTGTRLLVNPEIYASLHPMAACSVVFPFVLVACNKFISSLQLHC
jgi:hypothetical protein